ncbi:hypothetical protein H312_00151 [Anncaliia algerae PRA339]|uniref:Signal peptidase complex subunit 3 n=1 Tax=Anncaliia algerae PRA339 TaxID=1288291 RepID=A0A059F5D6_9MICR|nr:hypothetical protein H312_00151 [Anncaliia algerae PRA339]
MHSIRKRFSKLTTYNFNFTTMLLVLIFLLTHFYDPALPKAELSLNNVMGPPFTFDLKVDLTNQFHLNVKQIFLYLRINYNDVNNDVIWSEIIKKNDDKLVVRKAWNNYIVAKPNSAQLTYELRGCVFPYVGKIKDILLATQKMNYYSQLPPKRENNSYARTHG